MGPGAHNAAAYLISPDDLPPSEGEGATLEDGIRHIQDKKISPDREQAPDDYHYKISNAPLAANAAHGMAYAVEDGRNYKISNAPLAANAARGMAYAI